jgi:hypothetical protein
MSVGVLRFGSVGATLASVQDYALYVEPGSHDLGIVDDDLQCVVSIRLSNLTTGPVTLLGTEPSCCCSVLSELPLTIRPGERRTIWVSVNPRRLAKGERFEQVLSFYQDVPGARPFFLVKGHVSGNSWTSDIGNGERVIR